jgi:hypothetical protein
LLLVFPRAETGPVGAMNKIEQLQAQRLGYSKQPIGFNLKTAIGMFAFG